MKLGCRTYDVPEISIDPGETNSLDVNLVAGPTLTTPEKNHASVPVIRVGGRVQFSKLFTQVPPEYPAAAKTQGIQGEVALDAVIAKDGTIESLVVTNNANPLLAKSAVEAVNHWRYRPTLLNGQPVAVSTKIVTTYTLGQ